MESKIYKLQTPDGKVVKIEGPVGASKADIVQIYEGIKDRPKINKVAEGVRKAVQGATFQWGDEGEAYIRSRAGQDKLKTTDDYKAAYEEYKRLPAYHNRTDEQKARALELTQILKNQKQLVSDEVDAKQEKEYFETRDRLRAQGKEFERQNPKTAMALEIAGGFATPALGVGALKGASKLAKIGSGFTGGALSGALFGSGAAKEKEDILGDATKNALIGGVTGGALSGIGSVIAPKLQKGAKELMDDGVQLTPGQAIGGGLDKFEQRAGTVMPGVNKARGRAMKKWNDSLVDDVMKPLGIKLGRNADDDIQAVVKKGQEALSKSYDDVLPMISMKSDATFKQALNNIKNNQILGADASRKAARELKKIQGFFRGNKVSGQSIKDAQSYIGKRIQAYSGTTNADDKAVLSILEDTLEAVMDTVERQNPKYAERLKTINKAYAKFIRVENAAKKLNGEDMFTPKQFGQAVRQSDNSVRGRQVSAGNALMQDASKKGQILGTTIPDSGTAGNLITNSLLLGGGSFLISPWMAAIPGFSAMMYSKAGIKAFNKWANSGQSRQALREIAKKFSGAGASGLLTLQD